jgi:hypothetical protein
MHMLTGASGIVIVYKGGPEDEDAMKTVGVYL